MNNDEAKFLLRACRPNGEDASDPRMAAALAHAQNDPALREWVGRERAFDAAVAAKLATLAPPPGLREAILAGARISGGRTPERQRRARWRQPAWFAAAAAIAILFAVGWFYRPFGSATLDEFAVRFVSRGFRLEKRSTDLHELKNWLADTRGPLPEVLPAAFEDLHALGCRRLRYHERDVSLVCFERGGAEFHVFVARRDDFPDLPATATPRFVDRGRLVAAAWSDAKYHYVVVTDAEMPALQQLL